ncbi:ExeM/NucH family extracellular endonuclease [Pimelobacter simplex]|uniref:ExeM/NucH family extracellular endonuclease n=1 Tax=Nocardioides simplex TaxID=2045 RepID=UPI00214FBC3F|nr:ExeM/NucH family extracellular endonuclease [Pimelobacter simplex]UUW88561.1 ExeM/NucH family extracellular endonuclease [Pimelobacter simplex]UUW98066.1 ExeM/NucH family extracellular endonuclease [Pimelobacter simplex]
MKKLLFGSLGAALALSGVAAVAPSPAQANPGGTGLVIREAYVNGGSANASYVDKFVELYNPTASAISLSGKSLQYRSPTGTGNASGVVALSGTVAPGKTFLVKGGSNGSNGTALPTPDQIATGLNPGAGGGTLYLTSGTTATTPADAGVIDKIGWGNSNSPEGTASTGNSVTLSYQRAANGADTDNNAADFSTAAPTPQNASSGTSEPTTVTATNPGAKSATTGAAITPITLQASGGTAPYTWTAAPLPAGLTLTGNSISGTPTAAGVTNVTATVEDSADPKESASVQFTITVADPGASVPIADIQGSGAASPVADSPATTEGVVTALYPTGGFNGFYIQTPGADTPDRSDALFVYVGSNSALLSGLAIGDSVRVSGTVKEFTSGAGTLTELDVVAGTVTEIASLGTVTPKTVIPGTDCALPGTACLTGAALDAAREAVEGELFAPSGDFTVTDAYDGSAFNPPATPSNNNVGEIGLAANSDKPLSTPTDIIDAQDTAAIAARTAWNNAHRVLLDDGSSTTYWNTQNTAAGKDLPLPWLTPNHHVRVGAKVTFDQPLVLDWRFGWKLQPTSQIVGAPTGKVTFEQNRPAAPQPVGGDLKLATFNVLNYFTTFGAAYGGCSSFVDRAGNPIAVDQCPGTGPRGAWNQASFDRQQAKIVKAINKIDADIVSVEEIENSLVVDNGDRDEALAALVTALNTAAGAGTWDYVHSPVSASLPANKAEQDVIRTGFIYKPAKVEVVGDAEMLFGTTEFANAREPFAAVFKPVGGTAGDRFAVIVNHFKSKGSGVDDGTGQGKANPDRIAQATRLQQFASDFATARGVQAVFLTGDLNSYSQEDPMQVLYNAGYTQMEAPGKHSYSFDGQSGSLDHVLANPAAAAMVTGVDIWEVNANESVFNQYSRYNYVGTDLYSDDPFSASDHNPEVVGIKKGAPSTTDVQIIGTNDFHGRLLADGTNAAGASVLSGTVKQLRTENPNTVFAAAGDLIGASTFESFIQKDKPTIEALNEAGLDVSAAGNHEFDQGYEDLVGRVKNLADWEYIAANVEEPAGRDDLAETWTKQFGDVKVGFVGAVTEDLPSLVTPGGIQGVTVTDIVDATNAAAVELKNAGADLVVLLVHEGSASEDCTSSQFSNPATVWGNITQNVSADVDAIVSGHTHKAYNCSVPVQAWADQGRAVTERPVVSAGQYGTNLNKLVFTVDNATGKVQAKTQSIISLTSAGAHPTDPAVDQIVTDAKNQAEVLGAKELGKLQGVLNRAKLANGTTENRGGESTLGNQVAEVQRWATEKPESGSAQIAFMNPGGLRQDMPGTVVDQAYLDAHPDSTAQLGDRILTYKQAAVVQPFANTLVNMKLTGAQMKKVLEQQWQRDAAGKVPSRPFLRLGVSKGFTYTYAEKPVTVQGTATFEGTVTGMWLNGTPIDLGATYSVTVNQFLSTGGDNFFELKNGTNVADTGKVDLQAMVDYLAAKAATTPLAVDPAQRAVGIAFPADAPASYKPGDHVVLDVSSWTMSTPADAKDTEIQVKLGNQQIGTATLDNTIGTAVYDQYGTAHVDVTLPANQPAGATSLTLVGASSGTEVIVPITVAEGAFVNDTKPVITGTPKLGVELSATAGTWTPTPTTTSYQWLAGGAEISGATTDKFTPTAAEVGKVITVRVTVEADGYTDGVAVSDPTAEVDKKTFTTQPTPTISGTVRVGKVLTANAGTWVPTPASLTYQWFANGAPIAGVTGSTLRLKGAQAGKRITVQVRATAPDYKDAIVSSAQTVPVAKGAVTMSVKTKPGKVKVKKTKTTVTVTLVNADREPVTGKVKVKAKGLPAKTVTVVNGKAVVKLGKFKSTGRKKVTVTYLGSTALTAQTTVTTIWVVRR